MVDHLSISRRKSRLTVVDDPAHPLIACGRDGTEYLPASESFMTAPRDCGWLLLVALQLSHWLHDGQFHQTAQG